MLENPTYQGFVKVQPPLYIPYLFFNFIYANTYDPL